MDTDARNHSLLLGDRLVDLCTGVVTGPGLARLVLNEREVAILRVLINSGGAMVERGTLLAAVWGYAPTSVSRAVDVTIGRLRKKLEPDPRHPRFLLTCYADGYRLLLQASNENLPRLSEDYARSLARHVGEVLQREDCVVYGRHGDALVQIAAFGPIADANNRVRDPLTIPIGQGIVGSAAARGTLERIADIRRDPRYIRDSYGGLSELAVPILTPAGHVIGVLDSEAQKANAYSDRVVDAMLSLGQMAGLAAR